MTPIKLLPALLCLLLSVLYLAVQAQSQWQYLPNAPLESGGRYEDVYFVSDTEGWAADIYGLIIHTTNGGNSWTSQTIDSLAFRKLLFLNSQIGFAGTLNGGELDHYGISLVKTIDSGHSWMNLTSLLPDTTAYSAVCGLSHVGMNNIYAVGAWYQPGHFFMSHDQGNTWSYTDMSQQASALVECRFLDSLTGFISGRAADTVNDGIIFKTTDGGITWRTVFRSQRGVEFVWKMQFLNDSFGFASIENVSNADSSFIAKTTDGGETWTKLFVCAAYIDMEGIGFADSLHGWLGGWSYGTYATTDGGETWNYQNFGENLNRIFFISTTLLYGAGSSIYRYGSDMPTGINTVNPGPGTSPHQLFPCKPNPFSGSTTVSFQLTGPTVADLRVFDIHGRWVCTLMNQWLAPGSYSAPWNCSTCESGEYIVVLGTHQRFMSTRVQLINK